MPIAIRSRGGRLKSGVSLALLVAPSVGWEVSVKRACGLGLARVVEQMDDGVAAG